MGDNNNLGASALFGVPNHSVGLPSFDRTEDQQYEDADKEVDAATAFLAGYEQAMEDVDHKDFAAIERENNVLAGRLAVERALHSDTQRQLERAQAAQADAAQWRDRAEKAWKPMNDEAKKPWGVWLSNGFQMRVGVWHQDRWADLVALEHGGRADLQFVPTMWQHVPAAPSEAPKETT